MTVSKKLPDAEFDIMDAIWSGELPATVGRIKARLDKNKSWKAQTIHTLLLRLEAKGFIRSEKNGKERLFFPQVSREDYLKAETNDFMSRYFNNSFSDLVAAFYNGGAIKASELDELEKWLKERRG